MPAHLVLVIILCLSITFLLESITLANKLMALLGIQGFWGSGVNMAKLFMNVWVVRLEGCCAESIITF